MRKEGQAQCRLRLSGLRVLSIGSFPLRRDSSAVPFTLPLQLEVLRIGSFPSSGDTILPFFAAPCQYPSAQSVKIRANPWLKPFRGLTIPLLTLTFPLTFLPNVTE